MTKDCPNCAAMREALEAIACPASWSKEEREAVRLVAENALRPDAGSKLLERHREEVKQKDMAFSAQKSALSAAMKTWAQQVSELAAANQRAKAAEAALVEAKREHKPTCLMNRPMFPDERVDYRCTCGLDAIKAEDCPPSGILQEWQPWNGK